MPYLVTVMPMCPSCRAGDSEGECLCEDAISRRAVTTYEKAIVTASELVDSTVSLGGIAAPEQMRVQGDRAVWRVGLPDGTVIDVELVDVVALYSALSRSQRDAIPATGRPNQVSTADVIAAYNQAQGVEV